MNVEDFVREACDIQGAFLQTDRERMGRVFSAATELTAVGFIDRVVEFGNVLDPTIVSFRRGPAVFATGREACRPDQIRRQMHLLGNHLLDAVLEGGLDADGSLDVYWRFEEIHPLADGNGRIGMILFNLVGGTMDDPSIPRSNPAWG